MIGAFADVYTIKDVFNIILNDSFLHGTRSPRQKKGLDEIFKAIKWRKRLQFGIEDPHWFEPGHGVAVLLLAARTVELAPPKSMLSFPLFTTAGPLCRAR